METHRVQLISSETIKPSSETPHHLKKLKLSFLDQLVPPVYVPLIFFYQADELRGLTCSNHPQISKKLKESLSNTLTSFYPVAGRVEDNLAIDCNDAGVEFIHAQVHARLSEVIKEDHSTLKKYLPMDPTAGARETLLYVKITFFDCGGIAVGICFSHKTADCTSIMALLRAWAATCRGDRGEFSQFSFDLGSYFPAMDFPSFDFWETLSNSSENEKTFTTKRFVFDKEKLAALKKAATSPSGSTVQDPTRVELVSAFIWKCFIEVAKDKKVEAKKIFVASHAVNLRTRTNPPQLLGNIFGNSFMPALAFSNQPEGVEEFYELVNKLRSSIRAINGDHITKAQSGDSFLNYVFSFVSLLVKGEVELCNFSSWCGFPLYEVDYGWGNPVWFCATAFALKNFIVLVRSRCGEGIEAWANMNQDNLEMLESQIKLISPNAN